jgi:hypothetical protein
VTIYVVNAILGVILNDKNDCIFPNGTLAHRLNKLAKSGIIVRNVRRWRWGPST